MESGQKTPAEGEANKVSQPPKDDIDPIVIVSIPESVIKQLDGSEKNAPVVKEENQKKSLWNKMGDAYATYAKNKAGGKFQLVRMPRSEYEKYWIRDGDSNKYKGTEPEDSPEKLALLRLRLEDEELQAVGKKDIEREIVEGWKPLKERTGWSWTAVGITNGSVT